MPTRLRPLSDKLKSSCKTKWLPVKAAILFLEAGFKSDQFFEDGEF